MAKSNTLLHGALDALILRTLAWEPRHGYAIARWLESETNQALRIEEGSLYPALYRLEERGWIQAEWGVSDEGRRAKFYQLTPAGRKQFAAERSQWKHFVAAVDQVLKAT